MKKQSVQNRVRNENCELRNTPCTRAVRVAQSGAHKVPLCSLSNFSHCLFLLRPLKMHFFTVHLKHGSALARNETLCIPAIQVHAVSKPMCSGLNLMR